MSRSRVLAIVAALGALVAAPATLQAAIVAPAGFSPGEWYRLAFVTSGTTKATRGDIAFYDDFVRAEAALNPMLAPYAAEFNSIFVTQDSPENPNWNTDNPVFNTRGEPINSTPDVYTHGDYFYGGPSTWINPLSYDQSGLATHLTGTRVWTANLSGGQGYGILGALTGKQFLSGIDGSSKSYPVYGFGFFQVGFDAGGGANAVGGATSRFPGLTTTGTLSSTFYEPSTTEQLSQTLAALNAGQSTFILPGAPAQIWDLDFTGAFTGNATVTLSYNPAAVTVGPSLLRIRHWTGEEWVTPKNQVVDGVAHTITFDTESFSPFLLTVVPEPSSLVLGICAAAGLGVVLCRRRRSKVVAGRLSRATYDAIENRKTN